MFRLLMIFTNLMALLMTMLASFFMFEEHEYDTSKFNDFCTTAFVIILFLMLNICGFAFIGR